MNQYFVQNLCAEAPYSSQIWAQRFPVQLTGYTEEESAGHFGVHAGIGMPKISLGGGESVTQEYELYLGPKTLKELKEMELKDTQRDKAQRDKAQRDKDQRDKDLRDKDQRDKDQDLSKMEKEISDSLTKTEILSLKPKLLTEISMSLTEPQQSNDRIPLLT